MSLLSTVQHSIGFTRNEIKVVLILAGTFLIGVAIRWYQSDRKVESAPPRPVDYTRSDSVFRARSTNALSMHGSGSPAQPVDGHRKVASALSPVNINIASKAQLMQLPGIGPAFADRIIRYRKEHGAFTTVEGLRKVSGIGKKKMERLRNLVTIK